MGRSSFKGRLVVVVVEGSSRLEVIGVVVGVLKSFLEGLHWRIVLILRVLNIRFL